MLVTRIAPPLWGTESWSTPPPPAASVEVGKDYYVTVALAEVSALAPGGKAWDAVDDSGPDIYFEIWWRGSRVFKSSTKENTFIAKWSNGEVNLGRLALSGGKASMDDLISGARINIQARDLIEIRVYDADLLGDTLAGEKEFTTATLRIGDTTFEYAEGAVKRLVLRVTDMSQAVDPLR